MATTVTNISVSNNILSGSSSQQLVITRDMVRNFGAPEDYVELHISDPSGKVLYSYSPFKGYTIPGTFAPSTAYTIQELVFDPAKDLQNTGIRYGDYKLTYNILRPKIVKDSNPSLFIKEISGDRTEIRLSTNNISTTDIQVNTSDFINEIQGVPYFKEFYINFGKNQLIPATNVALDLGSSNVIVAQSQGNVAATSTLAGPPTVLIKLLNPLPLQYTVNTLVSVVDEISNSKIYEVNTTPDPVPVVYPSLRGPNFDLDLDQLRVGPTPYYNFTEVTSFQGTFAPQLQQLLSQLSASNFQINIDYTDYNNFVHYSSAARRLEGFKYKLVNLEATTSLSASVALSASPTAALDAAKYQSSINKIIQSFDGWEQYLYYNTGSFSWPKQNSTKPYIVQSVTSSESQTWYNGNYDSASIYDENNQNYLLYTLPGYIAENDNNELAFQFVASIGQMFDDIWIHIKAITDLYQTKNALDKGISKDLVYFALQSLGINTYTDQDGNNQFQYLYGVNPDGTYKPQVASYQTLISASNYQLSGQDQQEGIYKRLYSNLPLLLKSKGTTRFNQYLNTIFGIPTTIMGAVEYGGVDKITSSFEYEYDRFTYALQTSNSNNITIPWNYVSQSKARTTYSDIVPDGIEFRFKASPSYATTQSLFYSGSNFKLDLYYTNTGSNGSIYANTIGDFGYIKFTLGSTSVTSSAIPVFTTGSNDDTSWYNVLVQRRTPNLRVGQTSTSQTYDIYVKNNIYGEVGHVASASLTTSTAATNSLWYNQGSIKLGGGTYPFSGSIQEVRLWSNYVSESTFNLHVVNPESIEGNTYSSSYSDLIARWPLGNNLYTYNHSLITNVASVAPDQNIQAFTASFANFINQNNYTSFTETYYADVANSGYANPVTDKIRIYSGSTYGTQLMPNKSIVVPDIIPITKDIHLLDASLSPQDEIDRAIIAAFGSSYTVDDIIGNPATGSYYEFQPLQNEFFKKFINKYNYKDYIRLIDFFHNSLFKTLKDFTPARTNLSTGIVIKPHLLERPVIYRSEPTFTHFEVDAEIKTAFISASNGGNYSQSIYPITYKGEFGNVTVMSDARDFFTGELPSASIDYHDIFISGNVNPYNHFSPNNTSSFSGSIWDYSYNPLFNNVNTSSYVSKIREKITYINSGSKLIPVYRPYEIQDFTYDYTRHAKPRYFGSKVTSANFNFYTPTIDNSFGIDGPLGKNATINDNSVYFGYFSEAVATGSQLIGAPERTNLYLKYLIDESGSLTELFQRNYETVTDSQHFDLYQVQSTFKLGEVANISLFDNQSPSHQKSLDGNQLILASGIKYYPTLWKVNSGSFGQTYSIPTGISTVPYLQPNNYRVKNIHIRYLYSLFGGAQTSIEGDIEYYPGGAPPVGYLPFDVTAYIELKVFSGVSSFVSVLIPSKKPNGTPNYIGHFRHDRGLCIYNDVLIKNVKPTQGIDPLIKYDITDGAPQLTVNSSDRRIVSCSTMMSTYYKDGFYMSASISPNDPNIDPVLKLYNSYTPLDYEFKLNPGDIIRFDKTQAGTVPTLKFKPENEYTIIEAYTTGSVIAFKLDREVQNEVTASGTPYKIDRYVFSRKITDETNIIISHEKAPGQTSAGVVKNVDLRLDIDQNIGNIVSSLKSKIFSTVLKQ
jgi:hypothetical protein